MKSKLLTTIAIFVPALALLLLVRVKGPSSIAVGDDVPPNELLRLSKTNDVWFDNKRKAVVVDGQVCLREGQLEMFACPKGTKEHESVVSLNCKADEVHAGLLAAGAK